MNIIEYLQKTLKIKNKIKINVCKDYKQGTMAIVREMTCALFGFRRKQEPLQKPIGPSHWALCHIDDNDAKEWKKKKKKKKSKFKLYKKTVTRLLTPSSTRCPISTPLQEQGARLESTASLGLGLFLVWIPIALSDSGEEEQYGREFVTIGLEWRPRPADRPAHGVQATRGATGSIIIFLFFWKKWGSVWMVRKRCSE